MMDNRINLSISSQKLAKLIHEGHLCAADFTCLDSDSKRQVWQLCLICCQKRIVCDQCAAVDCARIEIRVSAEK